MAVAVIQFTDNQHVARSSVSIPATGPSEIFWDRATCLAFQARKVGTNSWKLTFSLLTDRGDEQKTQNALDGVHLVN